MSIAGRCSASGLLMRKVSSAACDSYRSKMICGLELVAGRNDVVPSTQWVEIG